mmetsp:Transcript_37835/g.96762  ORF Transcript_37835/g.96762 Transcript_37835/m.96762 type:complete len:285 (-) Transcript_37835:515-1369(-)
MQTSSVHGSQSAPTGMAETAARMRDSQTPCTSPKMRQASSAQTPPSRQARSGCQCSCNCLKRRRRRSPWSASNSAASSLRTASASTASAAAGVGSASPSLVVPLSVGPTAVAEGAAAAASPALSIRERRGGAGRAGTVAAVLVEAAEEERRRGEDRRCRPRWLAVCSAHSSIEPKTKPQMLHWAAQQACPPRSFKWAWKLRASPKWQLQPGQDRTRQHSSSCACACSAEPKTLLQPTHAAAVHAGLPRAAAAAILVRCAARSSWEPKPSLQPGQTFVALQLSSC